MDMCCVVNGFMFNIVVVVLFCNGEYVEDDFNDVVYLGVCIGLFYYINENWDLLVQYIE